MDDILDADADIEHYGACIKEAKTTLETGSKIQMDLSRALGKASDAVTAQDSYSNSTLSSDRAHQSTAIAIKALVSIKEEYEQATLLRMILRYMGKTCR